MASATLLPNGKQQFIDSNGIPLAAGKVYFYIPSTTTPKNTWVDAGQATPNTNPVQLDSSGQAIIYGEGVYRQVVNDVNGNLIWDQLTYSTDYGLLQAANNLSDVANAATALANLGGFPAGGGTITGNLTVTGTATLHSTTVTTPTVGDNSTNAVNSAFLQSFIPSTNFSNLKGLWLTTTTAQWTIDNLVVQNSTHQPSFLAAYNQTLNTALTGAGGLDTGTLAASTWYYVFAIYNATSPTQNILMSLSATTPTMPTGYTYKSRIGSIYLDGSKNIRGFNQFGNKVGHTVGNNLVNLPTLATAPAGNVTTPTWVSVAWAIGAPPTSGSLDVVLAGSINTTAIAAPNNSYGGYLSSSNPPPLFITGGGTAAGATVSKMMVTESANIYWASNGAGSGGVAPLLMIAGYTDNL